MMRSILLDTCAALRVVTDEISESAAGAMGEARDCGLSIYVSPISAWEIGNLARKGRFRSSYTPHRWFDLLMTLPNFVLAELTPKVLLDSSTLPQFPYGDPADRIIAATAREYGFTVMTRDRPLLDYGRQGYLSVIEC